jgi:hypothetical protein
MVLTLVEGPAGVLQHPSHAALHCPSPVGAGIIGMKGPRRWSELLLELTLVVGLQRRPDYGGARVLKRLGGAGYSGAI